MIIEESKNHINLLDPFLYSFFSKITGGDSSSSQILEAGKPSIYPSNAWLVERNLYNYCIYPVHIYFPLVFLMGGVRSVQSIHYCIRQWIR